MAAKAETLGSVGNGRHGLACGNGGESRTLLPTSWADFYYQGQVFTWAAMGFEQRYPLP